MPALIGLSLVNTSPLAVRPSRGALENVARDPGFPPSMGHVIDSSTKGDLNVPMKVEWIGRFRRAGNTMALFMPSKLRRELQSNHGWKPGDYIVVVLHDGLLMVRRLDKTMIADRREADQRSRQA